MGEANCVANALKNLEQAVEGIADSVIAVSGTDPQQDGMQRFAPEQFHREKRLAANILTDVVDGNDVRMLERRGNASFAYEGSHSFRADGRAPWRGHGTA